jgi:hypothetical protein
MSCEDDGPCLRCGSEETYGGDKRFQLRAFDFSESTGSYVEGKLCARRWRALTRFVEGEEVWRGVTA